jgi:hypothetical protein
MRTDNLFTALLLLTYAFIILYLPVQLILSSWKRKYFPGGDLTTAHAAALCGQILSAATTAVATLFPLKDYLNLVSATEQFSLSSGPLWGLLLICAVSAGIAYLLAMAFSKMLVQLFFKGKSAALALRENNIAYGLLYATSTLAFSLAFILPVIVLLQGFIPTPAIPTIR